MYCLPPQVGCLWRRGADIQRRIKCDGLPRCATCTEFDEPCLYEADRDGRKPATKQYVEALESRVRLLECMMGPDQSTRMGSLEDDWEGHSSRVPGILRVSQRSQGQS